MPPHSFHKLSSLKSVIMCSPYLSKEWGVMHQHLEGRVSTWMNCVHDLNEWILCRRFVSSHPGLTCSRIIPPWFTQYAGFCINSQPSFGIFTLPIGCYPARKHLSRWVSIAYKIELMPLRVDKAFHYLVFRPSPSHLCSLPYLFTIFDPNQTNDHSTQSATLFQVSVIPHILHSVWNAPLPRVNLLLLKDSSTFSSYRKFRWTSES